MLVPSKTNPRSPDPNTLANVLDFKTVRTALDFEILFEKKAIEGVVQHEMEGTSEGGDAVSGEIWLDSSYVVVEEVCVDGEEFGKLRGEAGEPEKGWKLEDRVKPYGSKLRIVLGKKVGKGEKVEVKVCVLNGL